MCKPFYLKGFKESEVGLWRVGTLVANPLNGRRSHHMSDGLLLLTLGGCITILAAAVAVVRNYSGGKNQKKPNQLIRH
jgi:hypothetical protein